MYSLLLVRVGEQQGAGARSLVHWAPLLFPVGLQSHGATTLHTRPPSACSFSLISHL